MDKHVELNNGLSIPLLGFGTAYGPANLPQLSEALNVALTEGYRHFDTAFHYKNEEILGNVFTEWISSGKLRRDQLFITTKLPLIGMDEALVERFLKKSLEALKLEYVDMYLIHWPVGLKYVDDDTVAPIAEDGSSLAWNMESDFIAVWKRMEAQVQAGRAKSIGISNFNSKQIERLIQEAAIMPAILQVEANLYFQQKDLRKTCEKHGITLTAYSSLGSPGRAQNEACPHPHFLADPILLEIPNAKGKTPGQIALRFLVQQHIVVLPKSCNPSRIAENAAILDYSLTAEEMQTLDRLDKGESGRKFVTSIYPGASKHPECPF